MKKPDKNDLVERLSRKWEIRVKVDPRGIRYEHVAWTDSAEDGEKRRAVVSTVMNFRVP